MVTRQVVKGWEAGLQALHERIAGRFRRAEPRQRAYKYLKALLSEVARKNSWQLAEQAGEQRPYGMQRLLRNAVWDEDGVRDDLQGYVTEHLGSANGVLVVDESGFVKKGKHSAGVKRQYSGAAGGIENCQVGVFVGYTSEHGYALIDRALYLPKDWIADASRCQAAHVPAGMSFATKPQLARRLLEHALTAQIPHRWVTADAIYGDDWQLRGWLEAHKEWYVLGVTRDLLLYYEGARQRLDEIAASLPASAWQQLSCGTGTKGERLYEWTLVTWQNWQRAEDELHGFLVRRNPTDPTDEAYFLVFASAGTSLPTLVQVAGQRWTVEECFELAKGEVGLDHYEVRQWQAWYRYITLAMLALAFLAVVRRTMSASHAEKKRRFFQQTLLPFRSVKFVACCMNYCGLLNQRFAMSWPGLTGGVNISSKLGMLISVASNAFLLRCAPLAN